MLIIDFLMDVVLLTHQSQNIGNLFSSKRLYFFYITLKTSVWRGWQGRAGSGGIPTCLDKALYPPFWNIADVF